MPVIAVSFTAIVSEEAMEELDSADPGLLHEYIPELLEVADRVYEVGYRRLT